MRTYLKLSLAIVATAAAGFLELLALAPLGGAIVAGALLLTSAAIVCHLLPLDG